MDLDGRFDLLGANGHLEEEISKVQATQRYAQPPQLFWNAGREAKSELVLVPESSTGKDFYQPVVGRGLEAASHPWLSNIDFEIRAKSLRLDELLFFADWNSP